MAGHSQKGSLLSPELSFSSSSSRKLFSPFSPMDTSGMQDQKSTTTPRRRLSLNVDENAQSPLTTALEWDPGYGDSQGDSQSGSSCSSLEASLNGGSVLEHPLESGSPGVSGAARFVLHEIKPSVLNRGSCRKTRTARRMKRNFSASISEDKENSFQKDSALPIKIPQASSLSNRPSSLPALPLSPLTQDQKNSISLFKQINSPLERMSLMSPTTAHPCNPLSLHRHASTTSAADSDGYFSEEVFDSEEQDDPTPLPENLSTLINAPLVHSPSTTFINKPVFDDSGPSSGIVCPTPVRPSPVPFHRSGSHPYSLIGQRKGSLKRSSPCSGLTPQLRTKRPPLPVFTDSNSCSPTPSLKGPPLLRSQSCSMPSGESLCYPLSPGNEDCELVGDFSKPYALPLVKGNVPDLKCITSETLAKLLTGDFSSIVGQYTILDCRYPYEYDGGHIREAVNIWEKDQLLERFFKEPQHSNSERRTIFIFHCEFSSKRGPDMSRFMRKTDRERNGMDFPKLFYPELYLLDKGYKTFYEKFPDLCEPISYRTMLDEDHRDDLKHFKQRSKSWNCESSSRRKLPLTRHRRSTQLESSSASGRGF